MRRERMHPSIMDRMMPQKNSSFTTQIQTTVALEYLLYLPPHYDSLNKWPLILFLHGRGERGSNLRMVKRHGLPKRLANGDDFPFIIVSPQCPAGSYWTEEMDALNALLDHIVAKYKVDTSRIYLTGMSM